MTASTDPFTEPLHVGLTIGQAAVVLGISPSTVRRRVRSGSLRAEQVRVGDGFEYRLHLEGVEASTEASVTPSTTTQAKASTNPSTEAFVNPSSLKASTTPQAEAMVSLIQTTIAAVLGPLVGQIEAQRQTIERQSDQLVSQAEQLGQQSAQLVAQAEAIERLTILAPSERPGAPEPEPEPSEPGIPTSAPFPPSSEPSKNAVLWWRALWPWLVVVTSILVVALLAWPR